MAGRLVANLVIDSYKTSVNDISPFYANDIIDQLQPKTFVAKISNGNGLINPTPPNYTHGFLVKDLEDMQTDISNNLLYPENQLTSIPDLVYQYDSTRKEINQTVLIPVMVKSIQYIRSRISNLEEDIIVVLINKNTDQSEYVLLKTKEEIFKILTDTNNLPDQNAYIINTINNSLNLLASKIIGTNNNNSDIYLQIINESNNQNTNIQQVRISNERKNVIIKSLLIAISNANVNINNNVKIMIDLALLPVGPTTNVLTRTDDPLDVPPKLVRLISTYSSIPELSILNKIEYTITETDNKCIFGMDIGDYIQIKFQYDDSSSLTGKTSKNLLYIKKTDTYSYEIKELDSNFILRDKEEIVTNEVKLSYLNNSREFTFYYVLGSFAGNGVLETNLIS